jgi:hypothetical protein
MFCPRSIHLWWREIWLERVSIDAPPRAPQSSVQGVACTTADKAVSISGGVAIKEPVLKTGLLTDDALICVGQLSGSQT